MILQRLVFIIVFTSFLLTGISAQYDSLLFDGLHRTYLVHLPLSYNQQDHLPLVIAMHGGFGSATNLQNQSGLSQTADAQDFIVVYPEGSQEGALNIRTWNAGWCCGHSSATEVDDVGFIDTLLDVLIANYAIDTSRIYATGMSNGGFMSYRLACELSNRIAAIAPVAASMSLNNCTPRRAVPVIHFHSYIDSSVPYAGGVGNGVSNHYNPPQDSVLNLWAEVNGCKSGRLLVQDDAQLTKYQWTDCECAADIEWYLTQDGGHSWPGGDQTIIGDPVSQVISANELMWDFFSQHSLECNIISANENNKQEAAVNIVFPNPSTGLFNLRSSIDQNSRISLFDLAGRKIPIIKKDHQITVPAFSNGIYILKIWNADGVISERLVLER